MNKIVMCFLAALLVSGLSSCIAETYTAKTGPFTIQVESNEEVEFSTSAPMADNNFNAYQATVNIGHYPANHGFEIWINDYGKMTDVSELALMDSVDELFGPIWGESITSWGALDVGGKPGLIAAIEREETAKTGVTVSPMCIAVYSPDGFGNRGSVIAIMDTNANEETFKEDRAMFENMVKNLRISRE